MSDPTNNAELHECAMCGEESPEDEMIYALNMGWMHLFGDCLPDYLKRIGCLDVEDPDRRYELARELEGR